MVFILGKYVGNYKYFSRARGSLNFHGMYSGNSSAVPQWNVRPVRYCVLENILSFTKQA